jgi:hypothetical protein
VEEARSILENDWTSAEINNVREDLLTSKNLRYSNTDLDTDLLTADDKSLIAERHGESWEEGLKVVKKQKSAIGYDYLKKEDKEFFNEVNWYGMMRKGQLMLDKAIELIDENVEEVLSAQRKVELKNEDGDEIVGYIDFIVKWKGYDKPIVMDLKTSSIIYEDDSVRTSPQLSLYLHAVSEEYDTRLAGYLVLNKRVKKNRVKICSVCGYNGTGARHKTCSHEVEGERCGGAWDEQLSFEINTQVIIDEIPEHFETMVLDNMDTVNHSIKTNVYPRNLGACVKPWGKCDFYHLCHSDKMDGLIELPEKEKKCG